MLYPRIFNVEIIYLRRYFRAWQIHRIYNTDGIDNRLINLCKLGPDYLGLVMKSSTYQLIYYEFQALMFMKSVLLEVFTTSITKKGIF